ncbi:ricin B-like lectin R40G2 [Cryptomeria japonica]|uniref:ricin B-like lectin R40G2 n=1 Tax=Cryptomeria japonica TaxID=3369 RepID=UPI0027DA0F34|nr:ricin B-like lectin R40G2 [Cryptomeria japonica]
MFGRHEEVEVPGEIVKIYCEANPEYYLTAREYDDVGLAPRDESNPHQQWIMDVTWGTKVRDEAGFPAFALVNKATRQALRHGIEDNEKVHTSPYSKEEVNEALLWTQSDDVGNGYKCIRPVDNTNLNLDANHGDQESGGIREGTDLILFKWKKHENQKWKIVPIFNSVTQDEGYQVAGARYGEDKYGGAPYGEEKHATNYGGAPYGEEKYGTGVSNYGDSTYGEEKYGTGVSNYGDSTYGEDKYGGAPYEEEKYGTGVTNYGGAAYEEGPAHVVKTHHQNDFPEATDYQEDPAYVLHTHHDDDFPEHIPQGQVVRIYCEQSPDHFMTLRNGEVVLTLGDADDISQHWIKVDEWGNQIKDEAGFPAFALVSKANLKALKHGNQEWDKVDLSYYNANDSDESILWTQSADVGHGYQCIRPVGNIHLNLDAKLADGKYGNIEDGNELILFGWKKQKNQKWKMLPVD